MKLLDKTSDNCYRIELSQDELDLISNSINEVCNGIDIDEFDTRIGSSIEVARAFLKEMNSL